MAKKKKQQRRPSNPDNRREQPQRPSAPKSSPSVSQPASPTRKASSQRATVSRRTEKKSNVFTAGSRDMLYGRRNLILFGVGLFLVFLGLALMAGGAQPDPETWDESYPYSFRRITLAPICMVAGFAVTIWGIFAKEKTGKVLEEESGQDS
jgi:uncharacterized membrane protein